MYTLVEMAGIGEFQVPDRAVVSKAARFNEVMHVRTVGHISRGFQESAQSLRLGSAREARWASQQEAKSPVCI